jgi:hypothetical protein
MLLDCVDLATRRLGAARLVRECRRRMVLIRKTGWHPNVISILADVHIQEIATVIVFRHIDFVPRYCDLVPLPSCSDMFWRSIEGVGDPQAYWLHREGIHVAEHIYNVRGQPTVVVQTVEFYIQPIADRRASSDETCVSLM